MTQLSKTRTRPLDGGRDFPYHHNEAETITVYRLRADLASTDDHLLATGHNGEFFLPGGCRAGSMTSC